MRTLPLLLLLATPALADWSNWKFEAQTARVESYLGREALFLEKGNAWLDSAQFLDGAIEFDVAAPAVPGFHGVAFRAASHDNFEHFYLRSHLSNQPDATQYTPVYNGDSGWQIYTGPRYALPATVFPDRWVHVRLVARGTRLEVSVDGQLLVFPELVRPPAAGSIGLTSGAGPAWFANVVVTPGAAMKGGDGAPAPQLPPGIVTTWRVSTTFADTATDPKSRSLQWSSVEAGTNGIANLAMARTRTDAANTVFAAVTLHAERRESRRIRFGFSDRAVVFLDGREIYRGSDDFQSRDPHFLGSVGLFDELLLPLEPGDHELWFAVSEKFGGWAVTMQQAR